jgi:hypothetical protein
MAAVGTVAFALGASIHRDRSALAVALVGLGVMLIVLAAVLPSLESFTAKFGGSELSLVRRLPPIPSVSDDVLQQPGPGPGQSGDLRGAAVLTSGLRGFGEAIKGGSAGFVIINLEDGRKWLSTRLYIFVQALADVRDVQAVVFTTRTENTDKFLGISSACDLLMRLTWAFPWLPRAFGIAWDESLRLRAEGSGPQWPLTSDEANSLYEKYVNELRPQPQPRVQPAKTLEWQQLEDGVWEHATWLDRGRIKKLLGDTMSRDFVIGYYEQPETLQAALATVSTRYVALVSESLEVRSVVDRWKLLDRAAIRAVPRA